MIIIYFRKSKNYIKQQPIQTKNITLLFLKKKKIQFYLGPVNTRGSNNVNQHKVECKDGKGANMCGFHMYPKFFMKFLQILHGQLSGLHCLKNCLIVLKIFRLSVFFISFGKFRRRTAPIVVIVSKPNLFVLIFLLVTVTPDLKLQEAFSCKVKISFMIGGDSPILILYISVKKYCKFL